MPRPTTRVEKEILTTVKFHDSPICKRINQLLEKGDVKDFCERLGITDRTVYHWRKGQPRPDIDRLGDIADYFGVTTDYLTGRIDNPSPNIEVAAVCEYTGLSDKAVKNLNYFAHYKDETYSMSEMLSHIITDISFEGFLKRVQLFVNGVMECALNPFNENGITEEQAEIYAEAALNAERNARIASKSLISIEDAAHYYRYLSVEIMGNILNDIPEVYLNKLVELIGDVEEDNA
ncbi:MAG: helix-turn-helix domain-containing protein [Chitinispirillales bacterium]|jgi:transcriptional regulator with XRE-family HTH domain|nr:helix-turn-helix domain-containing protein [Chitinispirillales bacterium]